MNESSSNQGSRVPFSFHCTICYEALNTTDRAPMVLPCGHTYLCEPCSERLDRCMECRTPLTIKVKVGTREATTGERYSRYMNDGPMSRSSHVNGRPTEPIPIFEKVPIPIAKNHVLMCLIETAAMQEGGIPGSISEDGGYESGEDDEVVRRGIRVLSSSSGTYKVREKKGLTVYPIPPKGPEIAVQSSWGHLRILKYGQTVQISGVEDNIATVARGGGYILANMSSQLVKVGDLTDETCKLEATRQAIQDEINALERNAARLRQALDSVEKKTRIASMTGRKEDVFGPEPVEEPLPPANEPLEYHRGRERDDLVPSTDFKTLSKAMLKRPQVPGTILGAHSFEEMPAVSLSCIPMIESPRSFDDFARFLGVQGDEGEQPETLLSTYFSTFWKDEKEDLSETRTATSQSPRSSSVIPNSGEGSWNYASGYSGHTGLNSTRYVKHPQKRRVRMMSHY